MGIKTNHPEFLLKTKHEASPKWGKGIVVCLLIIVPILIGLLQIQAPRSVKSDAPPDQFSSGRAMTKLEIIAKEPHPIGSQAHQAVQDYLVNELEGLGLKPEIQKATALLPQGGEIENIVTRIPGTDNSKAVMITAHYDSVPTAPGAGDDGAGIAAMLETIRALQVSGPLKNDLILLMTDGEETGLNGAKAFMNEHRFAKDVGVVLNFEARGNKGPSFMFETSDQNGWLIKEFIKAAPDPIAYSIIYSLYKSMPNDTDLTVFKQGDLPGLNFAFGMGLNAYHQPIDTPENLDPSSLQHHGEYMLSLSRHFGQLDLKQVKQEDLIYFNLYGSHMVSYPQSWSIWLMIVGTLFFILTIAYGIRQKKISVKGLAGGFIITLISLIVVFGLVTLSWSGLTSLVSNEQLKVILLDPQVSLYFLIGYIVAAVSIVCLLVRLISRKIRMENVWAGTLLLWTVLSIVMAIYLPGGSYLIIWPLLASLVGLNLSIRQKGDAGKWGSVFFAMPGLLLFAPVCYLIYVLMTLQLAGALLTVIALAFTLIFPVICKGRSLPHAQTH
ncbi:M20/M25/M40 family metallo-hydrolase [Paenibacillus sp. FJAT-27812]|uniref:M20/M25/M40 family metallo-hydrolase n=1 Tax=Paenibacillus sp. FJAT-27812 TaxID=1684143 RepID=UPI0012F81408|nr:M20/M25/M40 family metallo-hydrolase [Paenibacillus sp. FJAT-27812]